MVQAAAEEALKVKVQPLTPEAFRPYGKVLGARWTKGGSHKKRDQSRNRA